MPYSRREFLTTAGAAAASLMAPALAGAAPRRRPNILFILMDDMGWMDCTPYGSRFYETPNLERLARRSLLFTDAYAANPLCSPTRASILTGKYPARLGITTPVGHLPPLPPDAPLYPKEAPPWRKVLYPESRRHLPLEEHTIAEALREAGYRTGFVGKWHLGLPEEYWPGAQGFEVNLGGGGYPAPPDFFSPYGIKSLPDGPAGEYITDRLTDEAIRFMETHHAEPFFLCLWHYAVHSAWGYKPEMAKAFLEKRDPRGKQSNAVMAAMLKSADEGIGRVLDTLDSLGLTRDTVIVFASDNGGLTHTRADMRRVPPDDGENLRPGPRMLREYWRLVRDMPPTNNEPLRGGKATVFEGGTRVPLLISWPGVAPAGARCSEVVSSIDFYPTLLEMAGAAPKPGQILDGESLVPVLRRKGHVKREALFCHFPHSMGEYSPAGTWVRRGDWKLIRVYDTSPQFPDDYLLFNLREDIGETNNLAAKMPDRVRELDALIDRHLKEIGALVPIPNPKYDPKAAALRGWVDRTKGSTLTDGILTVECAGPASFIANASFRHQGEAVFRFRARSRAGGLGRMTWRTADQQDFPPAGQETRFDLPGDNEWHEIEVLLPVRGAVVHVRLYPAAQPSSVEFDWIRLFGSRDPAAKPAQEWTFDGR